MHATIEPTATQIVHGIKSAERYWCDDISLHPSHAALAVPAWDDERTDVHSIGGSIWGRNPAGPFTRHLCACGFETDECSTDFEATAQIVSHALHSCAACHGPKPAGNFPRCSVCAF